MRMVGTSKEQATRMAAIALGQVGPSCGTSEVARRIGIPRRHMYKYFKSTSEMRRAAMRSMLDDINCFLGRNLEVESMLLDVAIYVFDKVYGLRFVSLNLEVMPVFTAEYESARLLALRKLITEGQRRCVFNVADVGVAARLCLHVLDGFAGELAKVHQAAGRGRNRQAGVDARSQEDDLQRSYFEATDMLLKALGAVSSEEEELIDETLEGTAAH